MHDVPRRCWAALRSWMVRSRPRGETLHRVRTEVQLHDLPERFRPWKSVYERRRLWSADGTRGRLLQRIQAEANTSREIYWNDSVGSTTARSVGTFGDGYPAVRRPDRPPSASRPRQTPPGFDAETYKERNAVERCIARIKQWRVLAMRTDKLACPPGRTAPGHRPHLDPQLTGRRRWPVYWRSVLGWRRQSQPW